MRAIQVILSAVQTVINYRLLIFGPSGANCLEMDFCYRFHSHTEPV